MEFLSVLNILNGCLVLVFGLFLSVHIAGSWETKRQKHLLIALCPGFLLIQGVIMLCWDEQVVEQLYPLITHLPLILTLIFVLKKPVAVSIVGVLTAYLCCQLPHWGEIVLAEVTGSPLVGAIGYTVLIISSYLLLRRYFAYNTHAAITYSKQTLVLFGILPFTYYVFDYATTVYTNVLFVGSQSLDEFFPTVLAIFYVLFLTAYHNQTQKRTQTELLFSMLNAELKQSQTEIESLRRGAMQTAVYQHDMRHHLNMIDNLCTIGKTDQALSYIASIRKGIDSVAPKPFCENETLNLLCSSFSSRADRLGVDLRIKASVPATISLPDTEFCSLISNALENALYAVSDISSPKWVEFYCSIKHSKLLIEVKNPYSGDITMHDGIPVSARSGHGYGCRSIKTITENHRGMCVFLPEDGIFTLQIILPIEV